MALIHQKVGITELQGNIWVYIVALMRHLHGSKVSTVASGTRLDAFFETTNVGGQQWKEKTLRNVRFTFHEFCNHAKANMRHKAACKYLNQWIP